MAISAPRQDRWWPVSILEEEGDRHRDLELGFAA